MSEGPINFGKPLFLLVLLGCAGGGYYMYTHWPVTYESNLTGSTASVNFPHGWTVTPSNDQATPFLANANGPLKDEVPGTGWFNLVMHGTLDWPGLVLRNIPGTPDVQNDVEIDHKKGMIFEFQTNEARFMGAAVDRIDALVIVVIGCARANFDENRSIFDKVVKSITCAR